MIRGNDLHNIVNGVNNLHNIVLVPRSGLLIFSQLLLLVWFWKNKVLKRDTTDAKIAFGRSHRAKELHKKLEKEAVVSFVNCHWLFFLLAIQGLSV